MKLFTQDSKLFQLLFIPLKHDFFLKGNGMNIMHGAVRIVNLPFRSEISPIPITMEELFATMERK